MLWSFIKFSQRTFQGIVWRSVGRICIWNAFHTDWTLNHRQLLHLLQLLQILHLLQLLCLLQMLHLLQLLQLLQLLHLLHLLNSLHSLHLLLSVPRGPTWHWCLRTFHGVIHELLTLNIKTKPSDFRHFYFCSSQPQRHMLMQPQERIYAAYVCLYTAYVSVKRKEKIVQSASLLPPDHIPNVPHPRVCMTSVARGIVCGIA